MSIWDTASAAIDAAFAVPGGVIYSGVGITLPDPIVAIRTDDLQDNFDAPAQSIEIIGFEIAFADLPRDPRKGDMLRLVETGETWRVKSFDRRHQARKYHVIVEAVR